MSDPLPTNLAIRRRLTATAKNGAAPHLHDGVVRVHREGDALDDAERAQDEREEGRDAEGVGAAQVLQLSHHCSSSSSVVISKPINSNSPQPSAS